MAHSESQASTSWPPNPARPGPCPTNSWTGSTASAPCCALRLRRDRCKTWRFWQSRLKTGNSWRCQDFQGTSVRKFMKILNHGICSWKFMKIFQFSSKFSWVSSSVLHGDFGVSNWQPKTVDLTPEKNGDFSSAFLGIKPTTNRLGHRLTWVLPTLYLLGGWATYLPLRLVIYS